MKKFFNRGLTLVREISERLCRKINERLFSEEKIAELLLKSLCAHLDLCTDFVPNVNIAYDFIDNFSAEEIELAESQEKGSSDGNLIAITSIYDVNEYEIIFALKPLKDFAFKFLPWRAKKEIQDLAKHEAFHVRQYNYLCKHGGMDAIKRLAEYMAVTPYEDNIFELGAYLYQWFDDVQDFEECFKIFITPLNQLEAEHVAA